LTDSNSIVGLDAGASNTGTFGQTGFNGGLLLGYGVLMDSFYVGGEVSAIFNSNSDGTPWTLANYGSTVAGLTTAGATLSTAGATLSSAPQAQYAVETKSVDFKQKESFGLALRFGYLATQKAMLYLSLGLNYSRFSITENLSAGGNDYIFTGASLLNVLSALPSSTVTTTVETTAPLGTTSSARSLSFTPGVGTEIMLSNNLAFRTDFTYEMGKTLFGSYDTTNLPNGIKATRSSFRVGLSYHF
jgi:hypothetical protein